MKLSSARLHNVGKLMRLAMKFVMLVSYPFLWDNAYIDTRRWGRYVAGPPGVCKYHGLSKSSPLPTASCMAFHGASVNNPTILRCQYYFRLRFRGTEFHFVCIWSGIPKSDVPKHGYGGRHDWR